MFNDELLLTREQLEKQEIDALFSDFSALANIELEESSYDSN